MIKKFFLPRVMAALLILLLALSASALADDEIVLRISNWEEYIDLGEWAEDEVIDLESGDIIGENSLVEDFEDWYYETYGKKVRVEYSTFGTNEDLYNMLTIGDVYDLVCPSDYMIMKLMREDRVEPLTDAFFDESDENNFYIRGVSPYIRKIFDEQTIDVRGTSIPWSRCAAGYMWGVTGFVYNPEAVSEADAATWRLLENRDYHCRITIKDNVRDSYFAAIGAIKSDLLTSEEFRNDPEYARKLQDEMNDVSEETIQKVQDYLQDVKDNLYSFETDSGKADMITGKVVANYQWSGDAVYTMDQADEDDYTLNFAVPEESTNIYFDGWIMLKSGIGKDLEKKHAAEAFINFVSRPDNVIRNMYYIGYTSAISGGDDGRIFEYLEWNYGAEEEEEEGTEETADAEETGDAEEIGETAATGETEETKEAGETEETEGTEETEAADETEDSEEAGEEPETVEYDVSYFFSEDGQEGEYVLTVSAEQLKRQLFAQYPSREVINRASIMICFDDEQNERINRMWIRIRCFNIQDVPVVVWIGLGVLITGGTAFHFKRKAANDKLYS